MCGIMGYIGTRDVREEIIRGLTRLEYRGYDSAGIAERSEHASITVTRARGRVSELEAKLSGVPMSNSLAIGHTRWATHGAPEERNAHPHSDASGKLAVVHNGIIDNYLELKARLEAEGHPFQSDTDTEVVAHLVASYYDGDLHEAVRLATQELSGQYAIGVIHADFDELVTARQGSPLLIGVGDGEYFCASDCAAVLERTRRVVYLEDGDIAILRTDGLEVFDRFGKAVEREIQLLDWEIEQMQKGQFAHFMRKEIQEQPAAIERCLQGRLTRRKDAVDIPELRAFLGGHGLPSRINFAACGTSYHAALVGKQLIEELTGIPVEVEIASEFRSRPLSPESLVILVSQSGETADTLASLRHAQGQGNRTMGICNVVGSTIARESSLCLYTQAGPEIAVASTKAFVTQVVTLVLLAIELRQFQQGGMADPVSSRCVKELLGAPEAVAEVIRSEGLIREIATNHTDARLFTFLGKGVGIPVAKEGALKLAEISYIGALALPSGELKHGPIALIDEKVPSVLLAPSGEGFRKSMTTASEIRSRKGPIIMLTDAPEEAAKRGDLNIIPIPATSELLSPLTYTVALQLLSYHVADVLGRDIDKPRNLAKSVTVE